MWQCEIDPKATLVLERHWPDTVRFRDVTSMDGGEVEPVDVITFGSPCQDLSVAGRRGGLDGDRSNLFFEAIRIAAEMVEATGGTHPRLLLWENVPGAFSSNAGRDFAAVLDALALVGAVDIGWRVLDAQWFGVAQRRRRVFVAADLAGRCAGEVLALAQSSAGGAAPRREAGTAVAAITANGVGGGGGPDDNAGTAVAAITANGVGGGGGPDDNAGTAGHLIPCLTDPPRVDDQTVGQLVPEVVGTLGACADGGGFPGTDESLSGYVIPEPQTFAHQYAGSDRTWIHDQPGCTRSLTSSQTLAVMHACQDPITSDNLTPPLDTDGTSLAVAVAVNQRGEVRTSDVHPALAASRSTKQYAGVIQPGMRVRRLTPVECERLQGFPDGWTEPAGADTARYRCLGNAVCVPVAVWLGGNIVEVAAGW